MKNDTTFVRMPSGDHLGDAKMLKRAPRSVEFTFFFYPLWSHQFPYKFAPRGVFAITFLLFTTCVTACTFLERYFDREAYSVIKN